jgi:ribosomal protein L7/L12
MKLCDVVRLRDALRTAADMAFGVEDNEVDGNLLGFVQGVVDLALQAAERDLDLLALAPNEAERTMYREGQRIQAIGALRARVGGGLKEAKDAMERAVPTYSFATSSH